MAIYVGDDHTKLFIGDAYVRKVYHGSDLVYDLLYTGIPAKTGELARAHIVAGGRTEILRLSHQTGSYRGDIAVDGARNINRLRWPPNRRFVVRGTGGDGGFDAWVTRAGAAKSFYLATVDTAMELKVADRSSAAAGNIRWPATAVESSLRGTISAGKDLWLVVADSSP